MLSGLFYLHVHLQSQWIFVSSESLEVPNNPGGGGGLDFFSLQPLVFGLPVSPVTTQKKIFHLVSKEEFCSAQMDLFFSQLGFANEISAFFLSG